MRAADPLQVARQLTQKYLSPPFTKEPPTEAIVEDFSVFMVNIWKELRKRGIVGGPVGVVAVDRASEPFVKPLKEFLRWVGFHPIVIFADSPAGSIGLKEKIARGAPKDGPIIIFDPLGLDPGKAASLEGLVKQIFPGKDIVTAVMIRAGEKNIRRKERFEIPPEVKKKKEGGLLSKIFGLFKR